MLPGDVREDSFGYFGTFLKILDETFNTQLWYKWCERWTEHSFYGLNRGWFL